MIGIMRSAEKKKLPESKENFRISYDSVNAVLLKKTTATEKTILSNGGIHYQLLNNVFRQTVSEEAAERRQMPLCVEAKLATDNDKKYFFIKIITPFQSENTAEDHDLANEIRMAHHFGMAPENTIVEHDGKKHLIYYFKGHNLAECLRNQPLTPSQVFHILIQCMERIIDMHRAGYVHRDIKFDNFAVSFDDNGMPNVSIIDYGFTQHYDDAQQSYTGGRAGTFGHIPTRYESVSPIPYNFYTDMYALATDMIKLFNENTFDITYNGTANSSHKATQEKPYNLYMPNGRLSPFEKIEKKITPYFSALHKLANSFKTTLDDHAGSNHFQQPLFLDATDPLSIDNVAAHIAQLKQQFTDEIYTPLNYELRDITLKETTAYFLYHQHNSSEHSVLSSFFHREKPKHGPGGINRATILAAIVSKATTIHEMQQAYTQCFPKPSSNEHSLDQFFKDNAVFMEKYGTLCGFSSEVTLKKSVESSESLSSGTSSFSNCSSSA